MSHGSVTVHGMAEEQLPAVSAGAYATLARCPRRLHKWLTVAPEHRQRMGKLRSNDSLRIGKASKGVSPRKLQPINDPGLEVSRGVV